MIALRVRSLTQPRTGRLAIVLGLLLGVAGASAAQAASPPLPPPDPLLTVTRSGYDLNGQPRFVANGPALGADAVVEWRICAPDCGTVVASGRSFEPGPQPVGTTVEASATIDGRDVRARSLMWPGTPTPTSPPGIQGELRIGRRIGPARAAWAGGWPDDGSVVSYRLCRTAGGEDCRTIQPATGSGDRITIDPAWAGWFLGAVELRFTVGASFLAIAYGEPRWGVLPSIPAPAPRPTLALGPLAGPIPPAAAGTAPTVPRVLAVGQTVRPRSGRWPDAPVDGTVRTGLRACPTRKDDDRCVALHQFSGWRTAESAERPEPGSPVKISNRFLGWYVGAVDLRVRDARTTGVPPLILEDVEIPPPGPVVVHGPLSRTPVRLGFTPRAAIRSRAIAHAQRRTTLATVRCQDRCVARATVISGGRTTRKKLTVRGSKRLTVPARATRGERARVTIRFDHHPRVVRKTVRLG